MQVFYSLQWFWNDGIMKKIYYYVSDERDRDLKKIKWNVVGYVILLMLAGVLLYHMCQNSMQAAMSFVIGVDFIGEYHLGEDLNLMYYTNKD